MLRFSQLSVSTILNLIDAEVLIKIRIATSHCLCGAQNIRTMKTHSYSQTVRYILNEHPGKIRNNKKGKKNSFMNILMRSINSIKGALDKSNICIFISGSMKDCK